MLKRAPEIEIPLRCAFVVDETKHGKVYLLTGEGCVVAVRIRRRRGCVDEGLRRRRRRPLLVSRRGVRVMRRVVRCVMSEAPCTTQKKTPVARRRRHVMVVVLVHRSEGCNTRCGVRIAKGEPGRRAIRKGTPRLLAHAIIEINRRSDTLDMFVISAPS